MEAQVEPAIDIGPCEIRKMNQPQKRNVFLVGRLAWTLSAALVCSSFGGMRGVPQLTVNRILLILDLTT